MPYGLLYPFQEGYKILTDISLPRLYKRPLGPLVLGRDIIVWKVLVSCTLGGINWAIKALISTKYRIDLPDKSLQESIPRFLYYGR